MTREDIADMIRETWGIQTVPLKTFDALERFAALVAAAEREACAKVCEEHWRNNGNAMECADAIRARGEK